MSKMRPSMVNALVGRSCSVPSDIGSRDVWRWFLSKYVGGGSSEYDMECRWIDFLAPNNNKSNLHDKWVYLLLANGFAGNEDGMRSFLSSTTLFNPGASIPWKAAYLATGRTCGDVSDGGVVSRWEDSSGNNNHLVTNVGSATFTQALSGLNNRPCVVFDGSAILQSNIQFSVTGQPCSYVVVTFVDTSAATRTILDSQTVFDTCRLSLNTSDAIQMLSSTSTTTQTAVENTAHLITATYNGASSFSTYDGAISTAVNPGALYTISGIRLGGAYNGAQRYLGKVGFVGVYDGDITADPNWTTFKFWVSIVYGITIS